MNKKIKRRDAMKAFAAIGGLIMVPGLSYGQIRNRNRNTRFSNELANGWVYQGQPCAIYQQGSMLLLINEIGSVGSAIWTGNNTFTVLGGSNWDVGLTAQVTNRGNTIKWSNNTVWTHGSTPRRPLNLEGGWIYLGQPCAIFQEDNQLLLVNENGSIGVGLWSINSMFTILGGNGWDIGLTAQATDRGNIINWSNGTVWTKN